MRKFLIAITVLSAAAPSPGVGAGEAGLEFFEKKIRPVLAERCYQCHSVHAKKKKGGLLLDSRESIRKGGDSGPALVLGNPENSLIIKALRHTDEVLKMPPQDKLAAAVIADFEAWIKMGAPDPRDKAPVAAKADASWEEIVRVRRGWWSLQPVTDPQVPLPKNKAWSEQAIDCFLLGRLEEKGLTPAEPADPRTLLRRLSLALVGLPPTPDEIDRFVKEWGAKRQVALDAAIDRLLNSPHFGERWARHWMDVVRFTETHGNEWNYEVHHAWRYRDYLIRAFNDDVPYDQFVREHIAGDLLTPRWNAKEKFNEAIIGTAFYRFGEVNHDDCVSLRQIGYDLLDNQIDTFSKAFQAMTVACARCHNHKLDAVSMNDYYGALGMLRSSRCVSHTIDAPDVNADILGKMRSMKDAIRRELVANWLSETPAIAAHLTATMSKEAGKNVEPGPLQKWRAAVADDKAPLENPLTPWRLVLAGQVKDKKTFVEAFKSVADKIAQEDAERKKFNQNFTALADFRHGTWPDWQVGGMGLRGQPSGNGDFVIAPEADKAISAVLPAGCYTHALSAKLNGTLRSSVLTTDKKKISFQVRGQHNSAVRLVSNNCQLNYVNYRALISAEPHWITFNLPNPADNLRPYAELMTMFDNPKFPDQLGTLGGDKVNVRVPWEEAAVNPRSFFGITQAVVHDQGSPPKEELGHLRTLFEGPVPSSPAEFADRITQRVKEALSSWMNERATADDVRWLDALLQRGLLNNRPNLSPRLAELITEYRRLEGELSLPRIVPGLADFGPGFDQPAFIRGDCFRSGPATPRRYVEVLAARPFSAHGSGRLELANILASPDNPLTARVMVNRVWHHLFGTGLVRTVDDFGHVGDLPSHPELLDYLARRFVNDGWSIKRLIREIVRTRTFQAAHEPSAAALTADPLNRLLQHYPARRLEAEAIRDSLLFASGRLDRALYGMSILAAREKDDPYHRLFKGPLDGRGRRSIYIKVTLMEPPKFLEAFNFPGGKVAQGRRDVTDVPAQALAMLNDPFVLDQADVWGRRLLHDKATTVGNRLDAMFRQALSREPTLAERARFERFAHQLAMLHKVSADELLSSAVIWRDIAHTIFNLQEFITIP